MVTKESFHGLLENIQLVHAKHARKILGPTTLRRHKSALQRCCCSLNHKIPRCWQYAGRHLSFPSHIRREDGRRISVCEPTMATSSLDRCLGTIASTSYTGRQPMKDQTPRACPCAYQPRDYACRDGLSPPRRVYPRKEHPAAPRSLHTPYPYKLSVHRESASRSSFFW